MNLQFQLTRAILKFDAVKKPRKACEKAEKFYPGKFFHSFFTVKAHILEEISKFYPQTLRSTL